MRQFSILPALLGLLFSLNPGLSVAEDAPLDREAVNLRAHSAGTYYVSGGISGYGDVEFLVDTGSSYPVIGADMLESLKAAGRAEYRRELGGTMADGSRRVVPVYALSALRLGESCWIQDVEAAVFPAGARPILGMSILSRLSPFTFSLSPPELSLSHCGEELVAVDGTDAVAQVVEP